jgi:hypothetical protein
MFKFPLKEQHGDKIIEKEYSMCDRWSDLTVSQFFKLKKWKSDEENSFLKLLSILTNIPYETFINSIDINVDDTLTPFTKFLETPITESLIKCEEIEIGDKKYPVPHELNNPKNGHKFVLAQKDAMRNRFIKTINETGDAINCAEFVVACYYYPIVKGITFDTTENPDTKFKSEEAEGFIEELQDVKMIELYSVHNFFLQKLIGWQIGKQPVLALRQIKSKWLRALIGSIFSKRLTQSTLSQEVIH